MTTKACNSQRCGDPDTVPPLREVLKSCNVLEANAPCGGQTSVQTEHNELRLADCIPSEADDSFER